MAFSIDSNGDASIGNLTVTGNITEPTAAANYVNTRPRATLTQDDLQTYDIPLEQCVSDVEPPVSMVAPAGAVLGVVRGTPGTDSIRLQCVDQKANGGATSIVCLTTMTLPPEYVDGETVQVVLNCKMVTTVSDTSAVVDLEAWPDDGDGTVSADICATAAQSINSLTAAAKTFTLTPTSLVAGSKIHLRFTITINDAATGTAVIGQINRAYFLADIKG